MRLKLCLFLIHTSHYSRQLTFSKVTFFFNYSFRLLPDYNSLNINSQNVTVHSIVLGLTYWPHHPAVTFHINNNLLPNTVV